MSGKRERTEREKEYSRYYSLKWYHENKEIAAQRARDWRNKNKEYIKTKQREDKRARKLEAINYLGGCCNSCGGHFHPAVYEFHHIDPLAKDRDPSKMLQLSRERLYLELDKCVLLCANCHREVHYGEKY